MRPCSSATDSPGERPRRELLVHRRRRLEIGLLRFLDHRIDDVGLAALRPSRVRRTPARARAPTPAACTVVIGCRPGGRSSSMLTSRSPYSVSASERGIGVALIEQHVGRLALRRQRRALLHTEAMLLVDGDEAEPREHRALLHQRVRADDEHRLGARRASPRPPCARARLRLPVTSSGSMPSGSSRRVIVRACCSASSSVGAMIAA